MKVTEVAFIGYPVTDIRRARTFYENVLGLEPARTFGSQDSLWVEYDLGATTFAISNMAAEEWKPSRDGPSVAFEVDSFEETVARLREADTKFLVESYESPICRMAIISDPDGNSLAIHKRHDHPAGGSAGN
jgi:predicted enzyme related to lactoylglutathione lyase